MLHIEYTDTFDAPASTVFAVFTNLEARSTWIKGVLEVRVTPPGPVALGTSYFEIGKFSGFKSEKTEFVTEYEQDRLLTLATPIEVAHSFRETYRVEPITEATCRVHFTVEVGGAPKVAEFFMQQEMKKSLPLQATRIKSILASQTNQ